MRAEHNKQYEHYEHNKQYDSKKVLAVHQPVLEREVLEYLQCADGKVYVDATLGEGGHTEQILEKSSPTGRVIGIDLDQLILERAAERLKGFGNRVQLIQDNFKNIREILNGLGIRQIDGFLADLGISSFHLQNKDRGFSFQVDAPLDMRLDRNNPITAAWIINQSTEAELARILWEYGEERWSRRIARAIVAYRHKSPISTTCQLAEIVFSSIPAKYRSRRIHPATRSFQALRIAVNQELTGLDQALIGAVAFLKPGARICIISFHSLEDRIVKRCLRSLSHGCKQAPMVGNKGLADQADQADQQDLQVQDLRLRILTAKPIVPTESEIAVNIRARSAKLRVAERC